jgi:hypothetical protein
MTLKKDNAVIIQTFFPQFLQFVCLGFNYLTTISKILYWQHQHYRFSLAIGCYHQSFHSKNVIVQLCLKA